MVWRVTSRRQQARRRRRRPRCGGGFVGASAASCGGAGPPRSAGGRFRYGQVVGAKFGDVAPVVPPARRAGRRRSCPRTAPGRCRLPAPACARSAARPASRAATPMAFARQRIWAEVVSPSFSQASCRWSPETESPNQWCASSYATASRETLVTAGDSGWSGNSGTTPLMDSVRVSRANRIGALISVAPALSKGYVPNRSVKTAITSSRRRHAARWTGGVSGAKGQQAWRTFRSPAAQCGRCSGGWR